jgi:iron complex transport system substrate-binding protein
LLALTLILNACVPVATPASTATETAPVKTATAEVSPIAGSITMTDGLNRTITLKGPAQHIISLAPSSTEILYAVGAGPQVIARDKNSDYPETAKKLPSIGGTDVADKVNTEAVLAMKPDLVLLANITPQEQVKALEDLGLTVFMLPNPTDLNGMYENLRIAAKLTGHTSETETLITSLQGRVKIVTDKLAITQEKPSIFYEIDGTDIKAPWTAGPGSFIDSMITLAGGRNVGAGLKDQWAQISLEELVKQDPDFIVLGDTVWGNVTPDSVKQRAGWKDMKAIKNSAIFPFDDNLLSRPGPRLVDGLEALAKLLHPELFK